MRIASLAFALLLAVACTTDVGQPTFLAAHVLHGQGMLDVQNIVINMLGQATEPGQLSALLALSSEISLMRLSLAAKITDGGVEGMTCVAG